ncbi:MAG: ATP-grasp domain-containing protein [Ignavibacteria bacterium]|nr:ATP-grasp domain-containing protein [Ignavibacteria bacterium]
MRIALAFNIKKENESILSDSEDSIKYSSPKTDFRKYLSENLINNYPERLDDTYAEWDSEETITAVKSALEAGGHDVTLIEADCDAFEKFKAINPEFVFNVAEGLNGSSRESQIPSMLEMLDIPFTGSDSVTNGICHDKSRCKEILSYYNIPNANFFITDAIHKTEKDLSFPKFIKPLHEGSSKGIFNSSVVRNCAELRNEILRIKECYDQPSLVEDFLEGKEFTVAMLGNGDDVKVLPVVEINLDSVPEGFNKIYSYEVKWFFDTRESKLDIFRCPAEIDEKLYSRIESICKAAFNVLRLRDWARIDVRLDKEGNPNIVEINPLPGILPDPADNSCYPKAAREVGMDYDTMINAVLGAALKRIRNVSNK